MHYSNIIKYLKADHVARLGTKESFEKAGLLKREPPKDIWNESAPSWPARTFRRFVVARCHGVDQPPGIEGSEVSPGVRLVHDRRTSTKEAPKTFQPSPVAN